MGGNYKLGKVRDRFVGDMRYDLTLTAIKLLSIANVSVHERAHEEMDSLIIDMNLINSADQKVSAKCCWRSSRARGYGDGVFG